MKFLIFTLVPSWKRSGKFLFFFFKGKRPSSPQTSYDMLLFFPPPNMHTHRIFATVVTLFPHNLTHGRWSSLPKHMTWFIHINLALPRERSLVGAGGNCDKEVREDERWKQWAKQQRYNLFVLLRAISAQCHSERLSPWAEGNHVKICSSVPCCLYFNHNLYSMKEWTSLQMTLTVQQSLMKES